MGQFRCVPGLSPFDAYSVTLKVPLVPIESFSDGLKVPSVAN